VSLILLNSFSSVTDTDKISHLFLIIVDILLKIFLHWCVDFIGINDTAATVSVVSLNRRNGSSGEICTTKMHCLLNISANTKPYAKRFNPLIIQRFIGITYKKNQSRQSRDSVPLSKNGANMQLAYFFSEKVPVQEFLRMVSQCGYIEVKL
jgi:hypothetical protein